MLGKILQWLSSRTTAGPPRIAARDSSLPERLSEGDRVLIQSRVRPLKPGQRPVLTQPLQHGKSTATRWGSIKHEELIGLENRRTAITSTNHEIRASIPSLEEYLTLTPRLVTPVYPGDANLIVSILDLHVTPLPRAAEEGKGYRPLEILDAGTGHGALALYLSRAVQAANPRVPDGSWPKLLQTPPECKTQGCENRKSLGRSLTPVLLRGTKSDDELCEWSRRRRAIIHTLDVSSRHALHAQTIVRGFRSAMYLPNIDFHVGDVTAWLTEQWRRRYGTNIGSVALRDESQTFLSHAILDLPGPEIHLAPLCDALRPNGLLLVFCPSVTQLQRCVETISPSRTSSLEKRRRLPLMQEKILELGHGWTTGREWNLKKVKIRALKQKDFGGIVAATDAVEAEEEDMQIQNNVAKTTQIHHTQGSHATHKEADEDIKESNTDTAGHWVCRPQVGSSIVGGGFLGVWRKSFH